MRINVDWELCEGHGQCLLAAPTVFDLNDDTAQVTLLDPDPGEELRGAVERAASMCPSRALRVVD